MKTPLNVRWHYYIDSRKKYFGGSTEPSYVIEPVFWYNLINGDDNFQHEDIAIKISELLYFIRTLPLTSDFEKPIIEHHDKEGIQKIEIEIEKYIYLKLKYYTLIYENYLDVTCLKKDEESYALVITKISYDKYTGELVNKIPMTKYLSKEEAMKLLKKLPQTVDLGIFKLPFGNCFECKSSEE